jgi:hypothetical protein
MPQAPGRQQQQQQQQQGQHLMRHSLWGSLQAWLPQRVPQAADQGEAAGLCSDVHVAGVLAAALLLVLQATAGNLRA